MLYFRAISTAFELNISIYGSIFLRASERVIAPILYSARASNATILISSIIIITNSFRAQLKEVVANLQGELKIFFAGIQSDFYFAEIFFYLALVFALVENQNVLMAFANLTIVFEIVTYSKRQGACRGD